ncbi:MAG: dTDP-4-dehydrorhamnose reductase [Candidatus Levybacteria bacterium]|nr:dTDP-4-dehydrorhamnose reductase [Candidatus Levybacteria bacterium]
MKILLIGKNGQVGQEIYSQSQELGYEIHAFGREELDITNAESVRSAIEKVSPDVVINTSAFHVVPLCEDDPQQAFLVNSIALKKIAEICKDKDIKFVTYSTDYVFDGLKGSPYVEEDKPNPLQMYGISKVAGEFIALNYSPTNIIIRTCGVYGGQEGSRSKKGNFVLSILKEAANKQEIEVASEQIVNPTYAVDLAKSTLELLSLKDISGIYHLANEGYGSWSDFASEVIKLKGLSTKIIPVDRGGMAGTLRRPLFSALKNTKAADLGILLPTWQDGLVRYLNTL